MVWAAKSVVNIDLGSLIVVLVSVLGFLPWGVAARMGQSEMDQAHQQNGIIIGQSQASP